MHVDNNRIKKLTEDTLKKVSGGLETKLPLKIAVVTDDTKEEKKRKKSNKIN